MKIKRLEIPLVIISTLVSCIVAYLVLPQAQAIKWMITSIVDVPACTARVAERLEIQPNPTAVRSYILNSLKTGMTPEEVENTLSEIAPIQAGKTFIDEEQKTHTQILVKLCDNPLENVLIFLYYSEDGHLLNVVDAYED